jgi:hypothetical protein
MVGLPVECNCVYCIAYHSHNKVGMMCCSMCHLGRDVRMCGYVGVKWHVTLSMFQYCQQGQPSWNTLSMLECYLSLVGLCIQLTDRHHVSALLATTEVQIKLTLCMQK